jgi:hypothetical protein
VEVRMNEGKRAFHSEEYRQLHAEVTALLARIELLFRYSLVVVATVFAWLLVNSMSVHEEVGVCVRLPKALLYFGWLMPPVFVACAGMMAHIANIRIGEVGEYLLKLERALGDRRLGWEKHLAGKNSVVTSTTGRMWWALFGLSVVATAVGVCSVADAWDACPSA